MKRLKCHLAGEEVKIREDVKELGGETVTVVDWVYNACEKISSEFYVAFLNRIDEEKIQINPDDPEELYDVLLVLYGSGSAALVHVLELDISLVEYSMMTPPAESLGLMKRVENISGQFTDIYTLFEGECSCAIFFSVMKDEETADHFVHFAGKGHHIAGSIASACARDPKVMDLITNALTSADKHIKENNK